MIQLLDQVGRSFEKSAALWHFGRVEPEFTWERTDKAQALRAAAGL
jgi:S-adenosylmethionine synthetase